MGFVKIGYTQNDNRPRYAQLRPIEILQLAATGGVSKIIAVDAGGKLIYENVQTLTAETNATAGANLVLSKAVNAGGGSVWIQGTGATTVSYDNVNNKIVINSTDTYGSGTTYYAGTGLSLSGNTFTNTGDLLTTNEGALTVGAGSTTTALINSNTSGSTPITITAGSGLNISEVPATNTITLSAVDVSDTNEAQTLSAGGTSSPTITLSKVGSTGGGTITLAATSPIALAQAGGTITISSTGPTTVPNLQQVTDAGNITTLGATFGQNLSVNGVTVGSVTGDNVSVVVGKNTLTSYVGGGGANTAVGSSSLFKHTTGGGNTAVGYMTLEDHVSGQYNTAVGETALSHSTTGVGNTAIGTGTLYSLTVGDYNTALGFEAGFGVSLKSSGLTAIGAYALCVNSTGTNGTAVGFSSLYSNTTGNLNTALGYKSLFTNSTGNYNTAVGYNALLNSTGDSNVAMGSTTLENTTTGYQNTGLGIMAQHNNTTGNLNTAVGAFALLHNGTGSNNIAIGDYSGHIIGVDQPGQGNVVQDINKSIFIGSNTRTPQTDGITNEIVIGADANGYGTLSINLNSEYSPRLYIGNVLENPTAPQTTEDRRVHYEPLYHDQIGAAGTVLSSVGTRKAPVWGQITLTPLDGITITPVAGTLEWKFSVPCCAEIAGIKTRMDAFDNTITGINKSITDIQAAQAKCDCDKLTARIAALEAKVGIHPIIQGDKSYETIATKDQTTFTLDTTPASTSIVKMYINGVRISNSAYTFNAGVDATVKYLPEKNGGYTFTGTERVQFDYSY